MKILPNTQIKKLEDCKLGELVRPLNWEGENLGFVSQGSDEKGRILILLRINDEPGPIYMHIKGVSRPVLSYGLDYTFEIDHRGGVDLTRADLWHQNGAVFLAGSCWTIRVHAGAGSRSGVVHYNLESGELCNSPEIPEVAIFGDWKLFLDSEMEATERPAPLVCFSVVAHATKG